MQIVKNYKRLSESVRSCESQIKQKGVLRQMKVFEGVTENLKASDQMAGVGVMNNIYNRAEEIVLEEIVYR